MVRTVHPVYAHVHAKADTESLHGVIQASWKLGYDYSHGKVYAWIDSSMSFLKSGLFSLIHLINHIVFSVIGLLGVTFQNGRRFFIENAVKAGIDLAVIPIGVLGTIYPWAGASLSGKLVAIINKFPLKGAIISDRQMEGKTLEYPLYLAAYIKAYRQRSHAFFVYHFKDNLVRKSE